jgi:hypothetical protein
MKILICGDSFAADWTIKYPTATGWPNLLSKHHEITNLAQAGCSEYKIYLQLKSAELETFDYIIVSHTSPNRIYVKKHPVHFNDPLHKDCDLIYSDLNSQDITLAGIAVDFYENYFDSDYAMFVHNLICKEIDSLTSIKSVLHITNFNWDKLYPFKNLKNFQDLFKTNRGLMNHYDSEGNFIIYDYIKKILNDDKFS